MTPARVGHHQAVEVQGQGHGQAVNDTAAQVEATGVTCSRCGWYQDEHYPEDAEGEADEHQCPLCPACGHREPGWAPGEHTAP